MSDEEDLEEGFLKRKSLNFLRCDELNDLIKVLDNRCKSSVYSNVFRKTEQAASGSPLGRTLSEKVKKTLLKKKYRVDSF